jgi:hypothetical protein
MRLLKPHRRSIEKASTYREGNSSLGSHSPDNRTNKYMKEEKHSKNARKKILFPWWTKIIGHVLCVLLILGSAFFTLIEGITYGNTKVAQWIGSLVISILTSLILFQPIQVVIFFNLK